MIEIAETQIASGCHHIAFVNPETGCRGEGQPDQGGRGNQLEDWEPEDWGKPHGVRLLLLPADLPGGEVIDWIDDGDTPLCRYCGIAAVLPGVTDLVELLRLQERRFGSAEGLTSPDEEV